MSEIISVDGLSKTYGRLGSERHAVHAVRDISFSVGAGQAVGLVGESGSGKTTTARIVCGLERASAGVVRVAGVDLGATRPRREFYKDIQMVFQDPYLSLNPRMSVRRALRYSLQRQGIDPKTVAERVDWATSRVGLPLTILDRYPHQLSTGQRQRVGIARAIIPAPKVVVADEPVSSIDVSLQTQILNLLLDLQAEIGLAYLFISHDLAVVSYLCTRVIVMKDGSMIEEGDTAEVLASPKDRYTELLVEAAGLRVSGPDIAPASSPAPTTVIDGGKR